VGIHWAKAPDKGAGNWSVDAYGCEVRVTSHGTIYLEKRPPYCDRGRFVVKIDAAYGSDCPACNIDYADCFPRYYFDHERAQLEVQAWVEARGWDVPLIVKCPKGHLMPAGQETVKP
jgi:hypothetical protein